MRFILSLSTIILTLYLVSSCSSEPIEIESSISKAKSFLSINYDSAIYYANLSLQNTELGEDQYYSHFIIGYAYMKKKEYSPATTNFLIAYDLIPEDEQYNQDKANILVNLGFIAKTISAYEHAIDHYKQALKYDSEDGKSEILYNMGTAYKYGNDYDSAIALLSQSVELAKKFGHTLREVKAEVQIGLLHAKKENFEESQRRLLSVIGREAHIETTKYSGRAYHILANNYMTLGEYQKSIDLFNKALGKFSSEKDIFITQMDLGDCFLRMGEIGKALIALEKAQILYESASLNADHAEVFHLLASAYGKKNQHQLAAENYELYGSELKDILAKKNEIITAMNKQHYTDIVNNRSALKRLLTLIFTYRNVSILSIVIVFVCLVVILYRHYRSIRLKRQIAREINSI